MVRAIGLVALVVGSWAVVLAGVSVFIGRFVLSLVLLGVGFASLVVFAIADRFIEEAEERQGSGRI
jgi:hypothetical protein